MSLNTKKIALASGAAALTLVPLAVTAPALASASAPVAPAAVQLASYQQLQGRGTVTLTYEGHSYAYKVQLRQQGELLTGTLTDTYLPGTLQVNGVVFGGKYVVFSVVYPGVQGVRTFSGTIGSHGIVKGAWSETGSEAGSGPFTLLMAAKR